MTKSIQRMALTAAVTTWAALAVAGMSVLMASTKIPSDSADPRPRWPDGLSMHQATNEPTLVVCLHPRCPCSDATLDVLISILGTSTNANVYALFTVPENAGSDWTDTEMIRKAKRIDGLKIAMDPSGRQAARLGARTSGQTFLYDASGRLLFSGGITPGRGEVGQTRGGEMVSAALADKPLGSELVQSPVFGCALVRPKLAEAAR